MPVVPSPSPFALQPSPTFPPPSVLQSPFALQAALVPLLVSGVFAVVGFAAVAFGARDLATAFRLWRTDPTRVADLPTRSGTLEVQGRTRVVDGFGTVEAPFTGTDCLAHEWTVTEEQHTQHGTNWVEVASGRAGAPFRLEDDSGSVLVDPRRADLRLTRDDRIAVPGGERPPDRVRSFVEASEDVDSEERTWSLGGFELHVGDDRRYDEARLDPDVPVYVYGEPVYDPGVSEVGGQVNYRFDDALVSDATADAAVRRVARDGAMPVLFGLLMLAVGLAILLFVGFP